MDNGCYMANDRNKVIGGSVICHSIVQNVEMR